MRHCVCGGRLAQVPTHDAYSCLSCGALISGKIVHHLGAIVVAPPTKEIPDAP